MQQDAKQAWVRPEVVALTNSFSRADVPDVPVTNGVTSPISN